MTTFSDWKAATSNVKIRPSIASLHRKNSCSTEIEWFQQFVIIPVLEQVLPTYCPDYPSHLD